MNTDDYLKRLGVAVNKPGIATGDDGWLLVTSSNLQKVRYYPIEQSLEVQFKTGRIYRYKEVPQEVYLNLLEAPSLGSFFNVNLKNWAKGYEEVKPQPEQGA